MWLIIDILGKKAHELITTSAHLPVLLHLIPETVITSISCFGLEELMPNSVFSRTVFSIILTVIIYITFIYFRKMLKQRRELAKQKDKKHKIKLKHRAASEG